MKFYVRLHEITDGGIVRKKSLITLLGLASAFVALAPLQGAMDPNVYGGFSNCDPCGVCEDRFWFDADYLYWQVQDSPKVIPLVIEQPIVDGPFEVVLGGKKIKDDWHSGAKFALGYWFDDCKNMGVEASYFFLGKKTHHSSVASDANGSPRLRVPYFNVTTGLSDSSPIATPGLFRGSASLKVSSRMQGAELNLISEVPSEGFCGFKMLAGFRYWNFEDNLTFFVDSPLVVIPTVYNYEDKFFTTNNFYGGQLGASFKQDYCSFSFDVTGKLALGAMCQKSTIKGQFQTNEFTGSVQTFEGGFFALPTNIGDHKKTRFAVIPELDLNVGYHVTGSIGIHVGYSVMYASEVLRASKQMNSSLNPTQSANIEFTQTPVLVGEASPSGKIKSSGLWVQGVNVGFDYSF